MNLGELAVSFNHLNYSKAGRVGVKIFLLATNSDDSIRRRVVRHSHLMLAGVRAMDVFA